MARRDQNLTLEALHERVGYSVSYLHKLEADKVKNPSSDFLSALSRELEIDPLDLAELVVTRETTANRTNDVDARKAGTEPPQVGQAGRGIGVERLLNRPTLPVSVQALQGGFLRQDLFDLLGRDYLRGNPSFQSLSIIEGLMALAKSHADLGVELFGFSGTDEQERQTYYDALTCYKTAFEISRSLHPILKHANIVHIARKVRASLAQNRYRMARVFQELAYLSSMDERRQHFDAYDRVGYLYQALDLCEDGMYDIAEARSDDDLTWEEKCTEPALLAISAMLLKGIRLLLPVAPNHNRESDEQDANASHPRPLMVSGIDLDRQKAETLDGFILKRRDAAVALYNNLIAELIERSAMEETSSEEVNERLAEAYHRLAFLFRAVDENNATSLDEIIKRCTEYFRSAIEYRRRILIGKQPNEAGEDPLTRELHRENARKHLARYHRELGYTLSTFLSKRRLKSAMDPQYELTASDEANIYAEILWQYRISSLILPQYASRNQEHKQETLNTLRSLNEKLYNVANQKVKDTEQESDFITLDYPLLLKNSSQWHKMRRTASPPN